MVLYEYLQFDPPGFLNLVKEWPPTLYNTSAVINAVHDHAVILRDKNIILESLAILYSYEQKYEKALAMYLKWVGPYSHSILLRWAIFSLFSFHSQTDYSTRTCSIW